MTLAWIRLCLTVLLTLGCAWLVQGCGGSDDDSSTTGSESSTTTNSEGNAETEETEEEVEETATSVNVAGTWNGTRAGEGGSTTIQISFDQNDDALQGGYQDTSGYAGNFTGSIDGDDIEFTLTLTQGDAGAVWTFEGAVNAAGTELSGTMHTGAADDTITASK